MCYITCYPTVSCFSVEHDSLTIHFSITAIENIERIGSRRPFQPVYPQVNREVMFKLKEACPVKRDHGAFKYGPGKRVELGWIRVICHCCWGFIVILFSFTDECRALKEKKREGTADPGAYSRMKAAIRQRKLYRTKLLVQGAHEDIRDGSRRRWAHLKCQCQGKGWPATFCRVFFSNRSP